MKKNIMISFLIMVMALSFNIKVKAFGQEVGTVRTTTLTDSQIQSYIDPWMNDYNLPQGDAYQAFYDYLDSGKWKFASYVDTYFIVINANNWTNTYLYAGSSANMKSSILFHHYTGNDGLILNAFVFDALGNSKFISQQLFYYNSTDGLKRGSWENVKSATSGNAFNLTSGWIILTNMEEFNLTRDYLYNYDTLKTGSGTLLNVGDVAIYKNSKGRYTFNTTGYPDVPDVPEVPDYLTGYKEVPLSVEDKYLFISGITNGRIYTSLDNAVYGGSLSYFDKDIKIQPYSSIIEKWTATEDGLYMYQDFDISTFYGSDFMLYNKYLYLEGEDTISYSIYVPEDAYVSYVEPVENDLGGFDYNFTYKDPTTGEEIDGTTSTESLDNSEVTEQSKNILTMLKDSINWFLDKIKFVFELLSMFFNSMPISFQYFSILSLFILVAFVLINII